MNYSGFWRRFVAYTIDGTILSIPSLILGSGLSFGTSFGSHLILGFLYYPFFESSVLSATPGKALMNVVVLSENGERITFKSAVIRHFAKYLSGIILCIGYLIQAFTSKRQALHDLMSETVVIDRKAEDLNYFTVWKNQFKEILNKL